MVSVALNGLPSHEEEAKAKKNNSPVSMIAVIFYRRRRCPRHHVHLSNPKFDNKLCCRKMFRDSNSNNNNNNKKKDRWRQRGRRRAVNDEWSIRLLTS